MQAISRRLLALLRMPDTDWTEDDELQAIVIDGPAGIEYSGNPAGADKGNEQNNLVNREGR